MKQAMVVWVSLGMGFYLGQMKVKVGPPGIQGPMGPIGPVGTNESILENIKVPLKNG